jgi:hypothetical protein
MVASTTWKVECLVSALPVHAIAADTEQIRTQLNARFMGAYVSGSLPRRDRNILVWDVLCDDRGTFVKHPTLALLTVALATSVVALTAQKPAANVDAQAMADFKARLDRYVALRNKADDSAPPLKQSNDAAKIKDAQHGLAERIGAARAGVKPGEIFTPEIAAQFKRLLRPEAKETGVKDVLKEDKPVVVSFKVNGPYPDKQPVVTVPPNMLAALPPLPKDIEYRFIEKHLILRDAKANLIIDYMLNAIS